MESHSYSLLTGALVLVFTKVIDSEVSERFRKTQQRGPRGREERAGHLADSWLLLVARVEAFSVY